VLKYTIPEMENSLEVCSIPNLNRQKKESVNLKICQLRLSSLRNKKKNEEKLRELQRPIEQQILYQYMHTGSPRRKEKGQKE